MAKLLYQGHASVRLVTQDSQVIYIDPFAGEGYDLPASLVLITHDHHDHNALHLVTQKPGCRVITAQQALAGGEYHRFSLGSICVESVPACNRNHPQNQCVGYLLTVDGRTLYHAGDTSRTKAMSAQLAPLRLDYALLPIDGIYNMDVNEASLCADLIGAAHSIPIHMAPGRWFDPQLAAQFHAKGRLILTPGEEIEL